MRDFCLWVQAFEGVPALEGSRKFGKERESSVISYSVAVCKLLLFFGCRLLGMIMFAAGMSQYNSKVHNLKWILHQALCKSAGRNASSTSQVPMP